MKLRHVIIGLTLLVGVTLLGSIDVTISDRRGENIPLSESAVWKDASITRFRVDNYNVQRGKGEDGVRDLTRAAAVLQGADIAGIQELSGTLFYGWHSQAQQLADHLQMGYLFAPTTWKWFQPYAGSALLSKFPVTAWEVEALPARQDIDSAPRKLITAEVEIRGRPVVLMVAHLDRRESNMMQLEYVFDKFVASEHPTILMGDLNTDLNNELIKLMLARPGVEDAIHNAIGSFWRLDWIITKGFDVLDGGHTPRGISDHAHYWVDLDFTASTSSQP
tara:strand:+ start:1249 stop:2079 length:831 start_codon:yes stop_codon:yes gene_type:complete